MSGRRCVEGRRFEASSEPFDIRQIALGLNGPLCPEYQLANCHRRDAHLTLMEFEGLANCLWPILYRVNNDVGIEHVLQHGLKRLPQLVCGLVSFDHEILGDTRTVKPTVPRGARRSDDARVANRNDIHFFYGGRQSDGLRKPDRLRAVTQKDGRFHTGHEQNLYIPYGYTLLPLVRMSTATATLCARCNGPTCRPGPVAGAPQRSGVHASARFRLSAV